MLFFHCESNRNRAGVWEAVCLENSVSAVASTRKEARRKLKKALETYVDDINEELTRLTKEGKWNPNDPQAVIATIEFYMQKVDRYELRLLRWRFRMLLQKFRIDFRNVTAKEQKELPTFVASHSLHFAC